MLRLAFWLFVLFLTLSFFGISIKTIVESPAGQENIAYLEHLVILAARWIALYAEYLWITVLHTA